MKLLLAFGSKGYERGLAELGKSARPYFDQVRLLGPRDIDARFRAENARVLSCPRGYGYWLWKAYFLHQALADVRAGDFVFYCDALTHFIATPAPLFPLCEANGGIMLFHQRVAGWKNDRFTRMDCFQLMGAASDRYFYGDNLTAAFQLYQKTPQAVAFVDELLAWCRNYEVISDAPNTRGENLPAFVDHRHDQSILSILAIKHGLRTFKDISQFGTPVAEDFEYGQIIFHHRNRGAGPAPPPPPQTTTKTIALSGPRLRGIMKTHRANLSAVASWISDADYENSIGLYGLPRQVRSLIDAPIGDEVTYTDALALLGSDLPTPIRYLEIGVSVGKNFFQLLHSFRNAEMVAFDIEDINPVLERCLRRRERSEWPAAPWSVRKRPAQLTNYDFPPNGNQVSYLAGDVFDDASWARLHGRTFNLIFSDAFHSGYALRREWDALQRLNLLDRNGFVMVWDDLGNDDMRQAFFHIAAEMRGAGLVCEVQLIPLRGWLGMNEGRHAVGFIRMLPRTELPSNGHFWSKLRRRFRL